MKATTGTTTNPRRGAFSIDSSSIALCEAAAEVLLRAKVAAAFVDGLLPEHHLMKSEIVKCVLIVSHNAETNILTHIQNSKFLRRPSGGWGTLSSAAAGSEPGMGRRAISRTNIYIHKCPIW